MLTFIFLISKIYISSDKKRKPTNNLVWIIWDQIEFKKYRCKIIDFFVINKWAKDNYRFFSQRKAIKRKKLKVLQIISYFVAKHLWRVNKIGRCKYYSIKKGPFRLSNGLNWHVDVACMLACLLAASGVLSPN